MKNNKFFAVLIFLPFLALAAPESSYAYGIREEYNKKERSQVLNEEDIQRFTEKFDEFEDFFEYDFFDEEVYQENEDYFKIFKEAVFHSFTLYFETEKLEMINNDRKAHVNFVKKQIIDLLNYNVPESIEERYRLMGLHENGHKKIITLIYGAFYIYEEMILDIIQNNPELAEANISAEDMPIMRERAEIFLDICRGIFDERDISIVRNDKDFWQLFIMSWAEDFIESVYYSITGDKEEKDDDEYLSEEANGRLTFWSFTDELEVIINNYFKKDNSEAQIHYSYTPTDSFPTRLDRVFSSGRESPDIFTLESAFVRKYVESGMLMELTDIYEENSGKMLKYPVEVGTYNGRVYALSWQACPGAMFYRRSLAKKYLGTDDPQAVQGYFSDLSKMMETAAFLKKESNGSCVLVSSVRDIFLPFFYARQEPWIVNGELVIDPVMEEYMDVCKILYDEGMAGRVGQWSGGWFEGMRDELVDYNGNTVEVFSYFMPTWGLHYVLKTNAHTTSGDWAMIPGPVPYRWGGTWLAVNKNAKNASEAKELIRYITANESFLERYALATGDVITSLPVIQKIKDRFSEPFLGGQNHYEVFAEVAKDVKDRLAQATDANIENIFLERVWAYIYGEIYGENPKAQALKDFREQVYVQLGLWRNF